MKAIAALKTLSALAALFLLLPSSAQAQSNAVGVPSMTCKEHLYFKQTEMYRANKDGVDSALVTSFEGFLSGFNVQSAAQGLPTRDLSYFDSNVLGLTNITINREVDAFCAANPSSHLYEAFLHTADAMLSKR